MDIRIQLDRRALASLQELHEGATKAAVSAATESLFIASKRQLTALIYQKDIPKVTRTRGPNKGRQVLAWRRKMNAGGLLGAETYVISSDGLVFLIQTRPNSRAARYARARHDLNSPSPIDGRTRRAPWREKAVQEGQARAVDKFRTRFRAELGL